MLSRRKSRLTSASAGRSAGTTTASSAAATRRSNSALHRFEKASRHRRATNRHDAALGGCQPRQDSRKSTRRSWVATVDRMQNVEAVGLECRLKPGSVHREARVPERVVPQTQGRRRETQRKRETADPRRSRTRCRSWVAHLCRAGVNSRQETRLRARLSSPRAVSDPAAHRYPGNR